MDCGNITAADRTGYHCVCICRCVSMLVQCLQLQLCVSLTNIIKKHAENVSACKHDDFLNFVSREETTTLFQCLNFSSIIFQDI